MNEKRAKEKKRSGLMNVWRILLAIVGIVAVVQELQKPAEDRTWHGKVGDFVPYDFRMPTVDRIRETYWNPEGSVISSKAWGVGWAVNFGVLKKLFA